MYRALCQAGLSDQARRLRIALVWNEVVGPTIAARTALQGFRRGVLLVKAASPTWQNELVFLRIGIMDKLNELLGKATVRELKIISGHIVSAQRIAPPKVVPGVDSLAVARETSMPIRDPEVRAAFERLMAKDREGRCALRRH